MITNKVTIILVTVSCLLMVGCTSEIIQNDDGEGTDHENINGASDAEKFDVYDEVLDVVNTPTELTFAALFHPEELFDSRYGDQIREQFPNYTIEFVDLRSGDDIKEAISTGVSFDMIVISAANTWEHLINNGLENDISDLIEKYNYDLSRLPSAPIEAMRKMGDDEIYGFPLDFG